MSKSELLYDRMRERERDHDKFFNEIDDDLNFAEKTQRHFRHHQQTVLNLVAKLLLLLLFCILSKIQYIHGFEFADRPLCEQIHPIHIELFFFATEDGVPCVYFRIENENKNGLFHSLI